MKRIFFFVLLIVLVVVGFVIVVISVDKFVVCYLDKLGYIYEVDEDGDYCMVFDVEGDCIQMVYVCLVVEDFGSYNICEIWLLVYNVKIKQFLVVVVNWLLEDLQDVKMGGWVKQDIIVMFVVKIDVDVILDQFSDVIDVVICIVDVMELELIKKDEF